MSPGKVILKNQRNAGKRLTRSRDRAADHAGSTHEAAWLRNRATRCQQDRQPRARDTTAPQEFSLCPSFWVPYNFYTRVFYTRVRDSVVLPYLFLVRVMAFRESVPRR